MGWAVYWVNHRWAGYGVPALCDRPGCGKSIDRGLAYICGGDVGSTSGCGLYFCDEHLWLGFGDDAPQVCERCRDDQSPFDPTPDTREWVAHMLSDSSWQQWRRENPAEVLAMEAALDALRVKDGA